MKLKYEIYQLPIESDLIFRDLTFVQGRFPQLSKRFTTLWKKVYEGEIENTSGRDIVACEELFHIFNMEYPDDFTGHSLSVSDIIVLNGDRVYFCDSFLFHRLE